MYKLAEVLGKLTDVVYLSVLWIVCSLPIFTIGASSTALYHTVTKVFLDGKSYVTREFFSAFKSNFKESTIVWIIVMVATGIFIVDVWILQNAIPNNMYKLLFVLLIYLLVNMLLFVNCLFPSIARFDTTIRQLFKNSFIIVFANAPWCFLVLVIFLASVLCVWFSPITILFIPTVYMICAGKIFEHIFKKYINETK